jgi:hypothetical protein
MTTQASHPSVSQSELGALVREHAPDRDRLIAFGVVTALIAAFFVGLLVAVLVRPTDGLEQLQSKIMGVLLFGGFVAGFVVWSVYYLRRLRWRIHLFERGLVFVRGKSEDVIPWDRVQYLYEEAVISQAHGVPVDPELTIGGQRDLRLRLVTTEGKQYSVDNMFCDLAPLASAVHEGALASLRSRAAEALRRGEGVPFGPITLSSEGITVTGGRTRWWDILSKPLGQALSTTTLVGGSLAWSEVQSIGIEAAVQGPQAFFQVVIKQRNQDAPWATQRIPDLPNFELFEELVAKLYRPIPPLA